MQKWLWGYVSAVVAIGAVVVIQNVCPLSKSEWAAWVQAVASVAAIWWAGHSARKLQGDNERRARKTVALALSKIADSARKVASYTQRTLPDRRAVNLVAAGEVGFEIHEVREMERVLNELPLHELMTPEFVTLTLILRSTIRQLRERVEAAIKLHRTMNDGDFADFFRTIGEAHFVCEKTADEIKQIADSI